jgi:hypothetical protein
MIRSRALWLCGVSLLAALVSPGRADVVPLPRAHAHNDYEHRRPLLDALESGFCSVEADIHLVEGKLLVAHDRGQVKPERTLQALYLDPLRDLARKNGGRVYPDGPEFILLIDIKSDVETTYPALRQVLSQYADILTTYQGDKKEQRAVTVVITGNKPRKALAAEELRYAAIDGDLSDLAGKPSKLLYPLISDNWRTNFKWRGTGAIPDEDRAKLADILQRAHGLGCKVRFWGAPDLVAFWQGLYDAGVDLINTDNLRGLQAFLLDRLKEHP